MCSSILGMASAASQAARGGDVARPVLRLPGEAFAHDLERDLLGKRSSRWRSPVSRRPLTNCTTPSLRPCPRQRIASPQAAVLLPLPVPVWT